MQDTTVQEGVTNLQEGAEDGRHAGGVLHGVLHDVVDEGVDGVGVEGWLAHVQLVQDDSQRPEVRLPDP